MGVQNFRIFGKQVTYFSWLKQGKGTAQTAFA